MPPRSAPRAVRRNINNGGPSIFAGSGVSEQITYGLYDRQNFVTATAATKTYFATAGVSDIVSNFEGQGAMPAGQGFFCDTLRVMPAIGSRTDDIAAFLAVASLVFTKENAKIYAKAPCWQFPAGMGLVSEQLVGLAAPAAPATGLSYGNNGVQALGNVYRFAIPVVLNPQQAFKVTISVPASLTLSAALDVYVVFGGTLERNLQ